MAMLGPILVQLIPVLLGLLAPFLTEGLKSLTERLGAKIPKPVIPVVNGLLGAITAGLASSSPTAVLGGAIGAKIGASAYDNLPVAKPAA